MATPKHLADIIARETARQYPPKVMGFSRLEKSDGSVVTIKATITPRKEKKRRNGRSSIFEAELEYILRRSPAIPPFECNVRLIEGRQFEFDFVWRAQKIALELDGAIWSRGRHSRPSGILGDMEKYNLAAVLGYRVLRFSTDHHRRGEILPFLVAFFS